MSDAKIRIHVTEEELTMITSALQLWGGDEREELAERIVPLRIRNRQRNKVIRERFAAGQTIERIGKDFGLHPKTVGRVLGRHGKMGRPRTPEERTC